VEVSENQSDRHYQRDLKEFMAQRHGLLGLAYTEVYFKQAIQSSIWEKLSRS
jgi:hypothetical protein